MRVTVFSTHLFDRTSLQAANTVANHELIFCEHRLSEETVSAAAGSLAACLFANDTGSKALLTRLSSMGIRLIALRTAGFNHVDIETADQLGLTVLRVPAYSPYAVAEHAITLMLTLNRKVHRAFNRVREQNFSLDGLLGFDMHGRTVGIVGTGKIGSVVAKILLGFGCKILAHDCVINSELVQSGVNYVELEELYKNSDIITLHCPLTPETYHLIDRVALKRMRPGVMLINTGRGALIDAKAAILSLKSGQLGYLGLDVYEEEGDIFFRDLSEKVLEDDVFVRLQTFPNVLITAHQAFFTKDALKNIADTTIANLSDFEQGKINSDNLVTSKLLA